VFVGIIIWGVCVLVLGVKIGSEVYNAPATQEFLHGEQEAQETPQEAAGEPSSVEQVPDTAQPAEPVDEPPGPSEGPPVQPADRTKRVKPPD
jgi:hypothetical protein